MPYPQDVEGGEDDDDEEEGIVVEDGECGGLVLGNLDHNEPTKKFLSTDTYNKCSGLFTYDTNRTQGCRSGPFWSDPDNFHRILSVLWQCKVVVPINKEKIF